MKYKPVIDSLIMYVDFTPSTVFCQAKVNIEHQIDRTLYYEILRVVTFLIEEDLFHET